MNAPSFPEIRYLLSESDLIAAQRAWSAGAIRWQNMLIVAGVMWAIYAIIIIGIEIYSDETPEIAVLITMVPVAVIATLVIFIVSYIQAKSRAKRTYREHKALSEELSLRWNDETLFLTSNTGSTRYPWGDFNSWLDGPETLLLYQTHALFNPLPKHALPPGAVHAIISRLRDAGVPERERFGFIRYSG